jgi:His-Xaa-Ser system radical SAM maturase HxsC
MSGFDAPASRQVIRLRNPQEKPVDHADVALLRTPADTDVARRNGFSAVAVLGELNTPVDFASRGIRISEKFAYLSDGDILGIHPLSKRFRTLYRRNSKHNSFLVTERCNHNCLMCSQPPKDVDDRWILKEIRQALPLVDKNTCSIGFTGGEPLLDSREFIANLVECRNLLPATAVHVLSNGRAFACSEVTDAWAAVCHPNLTVGIPVYAAVDSVHDYVVQAKGAFDETILGILKLKDRKQRVEVRVVLHAITAPRIVETCRWLARNLPFVDHVALMGLENTGFAIANDDLLWIDPMDYRDDLEKAVNFLDAAGVPVSIYNLPRCILGKPLWRYAEQSISDWKNDFLTECEACVEKPKCSGFFTTGKPRYSRGIHPFGIAA